MTKSPVRPADIYLRFLQLAEELARTPSLPSLDPLEERILMFVATKAQANGRLSVRDMMACAELGSPVTVHNRLKSMRQKGWLVLANTEDTRRKQVELTEAALLHLDNMASCLVRAARS